MDFIAKGESEVIVKSWHEFILEGRAKENRQSAKIFTISSKYFFWHWIGDYGEIWLINFISDNFCNFINLEYIFFNSIFNIYK